MLLVVIARKHNKDSASVNWAAKDVNISTAHGFIGGQKIRITMLSCWERTRSRFPRPQVPAWMQKPRLPAGAGSDTAPLGGSLPSPGLRSAVPVPLQEHASQGNSRLHSQAPKVPCAPQVRTPGALRDAGLASSAPKQAGEGTEFGSLCPPYR